jgi:hypothetical protein
MIASPELMLTAVWNPLSRSSPSPQRAWTLLCILPASRHGFPVGCPPARPAASVSQTRYPYGWRSCPHAKTVDESVESHRLRRADHPPYSVDLAPSGLFLFGFIKGQLKGTHFPDGQELICEVKCIVSETPPEMVRSTVGAGMDRLERCSTIGRDYVEDRV